MTHDMRSLMMIVESMEHSVLNDNFQRWFGASKVVGPDGNPLVVYHGSNAHAYVAGEIDIFHCLPASGRGAAFFTSSKTLAGEYGERLYSVYLRMLNPLVVYGDGKSWSSLGKTTRISGDVTPALRAHHDKEAVDLDNLLSQFEDDDLINPPDSDGKKLPKSAPRSRISPDTHSLDKLGLGIIPSLDGRSVETDQIVRQARRMGFDGVVFKDINDSPTSDAHLYEQKPSDVYAVFRPSQIKSVRNGGGWSAEEDDSNL